MNILNLGLGTPFVSQKLILVPIIIIIVINYWKYHFVLSEKRNNCHYSSYHYRCHLWYYILLSASLSLIVCADIFRVSVECEGEYVKTFLQIIHVCLCFISNSLIFKKEKLILAGVLLQIIKGHYYFV